jgi:predicted kinase
MSIKHWLARIVRPHMPEVNETVEMPRMIIVTGPPGVGKSTVAAGLARCLGMEHVETDTLLREDLHKVNAMPPEQRHAEFTRVYRSAHDAAARTLRAAGRVVLDGSYLLPERRFAAQDMAAGLSVAPVILTFHDDDGAAARDSARPPERRVGRHDNYRNLNEEMLGVLPDEGWPGRVHLECRRGRWRAYATRDARALARLALSIAASLPTAAQLRATAARRHGG